MENTEKMLAEMRDKYEFNSPKVFSAMRKVPRDKFAPKEYKSLAYHDSPIPIGFGQTMSQPYTVAFMTRLLINKKKKEDRSKVLEIGTGSGYQAAILSKLFQEVYTIEIVPELAKKVRKKLKRLGYKNIYVKTGSGEWGWKEKSPFDAVLITANILDHLPKELAEQLKNGGVIVTPIKGVMTKFTKRNNSLKKEEHGEFSFVPFIREPN